jgi:hypothetical protein
MPRDAVKDERLPIARPCGLFLTSTEALNMELAEPDPFLALTEIWAAISPTFRAETSRKCSASASMRCRHSLPSEGLRA